MLFETLSETIKQLNIPQLPDDINNMIVKDNWESLRRASGTNPIIDDTHHFLQNVQEKLANLECHIATQSGKRKKCEVEVHFDDRNITGASTNPKHAKKVEDKRDTWHDDQTWTNNFSYRNGDSGLKLAGNGYHEGEHANQTTGYGYTNDQKKMMFIAKTFYTRDGSSPLYRNNFSEVYARIAEAKFYIAAFQRLQTVAQHLLVSQEYYNALCDAHTHLIAKVDISTMLQMNEDQITWLRNPLHRASGLKNAFPEANAFTINYVAMHFMQHKAPELYKQAVADMQKVADVLKDMISLIENQRKIDKETAERQEQQAILNKVKEMMAKHNIPILEEMPSPRPDMCCTLTKLDKIEEYLTPATNKYNLCIIPTPRFGLCAWYDLSPRYRAYVDPNFTAHTPATNNEMCEPILKSEEYEQDDISK